MTLWSGMLCSSPIALQHPNGDLTVHSTFTETALEIARAIEDDTVTDAEIGELAIVLIRDMCVDTHLGPFELIEVSPFETFEETSTISQW